MKKLVSRYSEFIFEKKESTLKGIPYENMVYLFYAANWLAQLQVDL